MAGEENDIVLPITLSTDEAERVWASLKKRFENDPPKVPPPGPPSPDVPKGWKGLTERLQEYRAEQMRSSREARFFANELMSLVPGAGQATGSMRQFINVLIEGAAGGVGFGVAFEAVKLGLGVLSDYLTESSERAKKFGEEMKQAADESKRKIDELVEATRVAALVSLGYTESQAQTIRKMQEADKAAKVQADSLALVKEEIAELRKNPYIGSAERVKQLEMEQVKYEQGAAAASKYRNELEVLAAQAQEQRRRDQAALADKTIYELQQADLKARRAAGLASLEMAKATAGERERIELEGESKIAKLQQDAWAEQNAIARRSLLDQVRFEQEQLQRRLENYDAFLLAQQSRFANGPFREAPAGELNTPAGDGAAEAARRLAEETKANAEKLRAAKALAAGLDPEAQNRTREELALLDEVAAKYGEVAGVLEMVEGAKTRIVEREVQARVQKWKEETVAGQMFQVAMGAIGNSVGSAFSKLATHAGAYDRAMRAAGKAQAATASEMAGAALAWTQEVLAAIAQQAAIKAIFALAEGFLQSSFGNVKGASEAFAAAALYGSVAGAAAAVGYGVGEARPMTQEERRQVEGGSGTGGTSPYPAPYQVGTSAREAGAAAVDAQRGGGTTNIYVNNNISTHTPRDFQRYLETEGSDAFLGAQENLARLGRGRVARR